MTDAPLKACPFCGTTEMLRRIGAPPNEGYSFVRCDYCDAEGPCPENLPRHWNTRKSPDDDWTRWKMGETIDALAKDRGCTRERMRLRLKKLDEGRSVLELQRQVQELRRALEAAEMRECAAFSAGFEAGQKDAVNCRERATDTPPLASQ